MGFIANLGMGLAGQAASGLVDTGLGLLLEKHNDKRQIRQQQKLQNMQIQGQKEMSQFNQEMALRMWEATNYGPQMEQLRKAGLNPGLVYGMSGGGGTTAASQPGNVTGGSANQAPPISTTGMGMNLQLLEAQKEVLESQAELNRAEATKKSGVDTTEANTRIESLKQGITNAKAQEKLQGVELALKELDKWEQQKSQGDRMEYIAFQTGKAMQELEIAMAESFVARETQVAKRDIILQEAIGATLRNALLESNVKVQDAQIKKWAAEIQQNTRSLDQKDLDLAIRKFEAEIKAQFPGVGNTLGRILNDGIEEIFNSIKGSRENRYKIK